MIARALWNCTLDRVTGFGAGLLVLACVLGTIGCGGSEPVGNTAVPEVPPANAEPVSGGLSGPEVKIGK